MARITILGTGERVEGDAAIGAFLNARGIEFERWPIREAADLTAAYRPELDRLAREKGYIDADVIRLTPEVPNLEALLAKFDKEHFHDDDEVRFIQAGEGTFGLALEGGERFEILVEAGDYVSIPARFWHWFTLTPARRITAIRLFKDRSGWVPHYRPSAATGAAV